MELLLTRMHSSRMRTARLLTAVGGVQECLCLCPEVGVSRDMSGGVTSGVCPGVCVCPEGVSMG